MDNRSDLSTTEGQFTLLVSQGVGLYPNSIAKMLNARFIAKGYDLDDCDMYTIHTEIMTILNEVAQASNNNKENNYE
ncbi:MAG: hypothetical protein EB127_03865 [Alphaproteobacteria bacterium]|nr:hypothetical protein [Alphaproteobacteria bacterium]